MMADDIESIDVKDLTTGAVNGTGVFDELMKSVQARLDQEYNKNRIKGTEYSTVYLGSIQTTMQQSIAFLLGKDKAANEASLIAAQALLVEAQIKETEAKIELLELEKPKIQAEIRAIDAGIEKINADIILMGKQGEKLDEDIKLTAQQVLNSEQDFYKIQAEVELIDEQVRKVTADTVLTEQQAENAITEGELLVLNKDKTTEEIDSIQQSIQNAIAAQYSEEAKIKDVVNGVAVKGLIGAQKSKVDSEIEFTDQKLVTEQAQTQNDISGTKVGGVMGKKIDLYQTQIDGFNRDAEQKLAKIMTDTWSVRVATNENTDTNYTNLDNPSIGEVIAKAKAGINI